MKKMLMAVGSIILALLLVVIGFQLGEWHQRQSQKTQSQSASPKQAGGGEIMPSESINPENGEKPDIPEQENVDRTISKLDISAVSDDEWTKVYSDTLSTSDETVSLYTSAEKDDDGYLWDSNHKWVVEVSSGSGYYTLYDQNVTQGRVYFDAASRENGDLIITVFTLSSAGISVNQYNRTASGNVFTEKTVYNSGAVNRLFTSIPDYE